VVRAVHLANSISFSRNSDTRKSFLAGLQVIPELIEKAADFETVLD